MDDPANSVNSIVESMKNWYSSIVELSSPSLTTLQRQTAEERLRGMFHDEGITYSFSGSDEPGYSSILFNFASLYVADTGIIKDVHSKGNHPISLAVGERVSVAFEPRDIRHVASYQRGDIKNAEFIHLKKGTTYAFRGKIAWARYYFNTERFDLHVDSQHRANPMSLESLNEFFDPEGGGVTIVTAILGSVAGGYLGFLGGGIGGAVVGAVIGAVCGFWVPYILTVVTLYAAIALLFGAAIAVIVFVIWLIASLWGVGKP